jgi:DNA anti-recombination protein RmuC
VNDAEKLHLRMTGKIKEIGTQVKEQAEQKARLAAHAVRSEVNKQYRNYQQNRQERKQFNTHLKQIEREEYAKARGQVRAERQSGIEEEVRGRARARARSEARPRSEKIAANLKQVRKVVKYTPEKEVFQLPTNFATPNISAHPSNLGGLNEFLIPHNIPPSSRLNDYLTPKMKKRGAR